MDSENLTEIAHRSYAGVYPENTGKAVEKAVSGDARPDMIEIDVQPCKGGGPVCLSR